METAPSTLAPGDDPTVKQLELEMAAIFAKEAAVFVPSGTMGNLIAVGVHCEVRGSEFICGNLSHIHVYEQGGLSTLMGAHPRIITNKNDGTMDLDEIRGAVRANDQHFPVTRVLCIEQTHNKCGGRVLTLDYVVRDLGHVEINRLTRELERRRVFVFPRIIKNPK